MCPAKCFCLCHDTLWGAANKKRKIPTVNLIFCPSVTNGAVFVANTLSTAASASFLPWERCDSSVSESKPTADASAVPSGILTVGMSDTLFYEGAALLSHDQESLLQRLQIPSTIIFSRRRVGTVGVACLARSDMLHDACGYWLGLPKWTLPKYFSFPYSNGYCIAICQGCDAWRSSPRNDFGNYDNLVKAARINNQWRIGQMKISVKQPRLKSANI